MGSLTPLLQVSTIKRGKLQEREQRMGLTGCQALEEWCRLLLNSYPGVNINNMTSAWADGKAFNALIHSQRPDLIDWETVKRSNSYQNCHRAFQTAEARLGISALLDVADVARGSPDRLSILTYVSQFYHKFQSDSSDSGISSPSEEQDRASRRGGVHSLINIKRSRSVSSSPPIEKENPFRKEFLDLPVEHISSRAEKSPCKKLVNKFHKQKSSEQQSVRLRHQNTEGENKTRRLVRSMFVEPSQDAEKRQDEDNNTKLRGRFQHDRRTLISAPRPYRNIGSAETESILSKTQSYLQEKRKRSQSQPPVEKKEKRKTFDFLSTSNFSQIQVRKKSNDSVNSTPKNTSDFLKITASPKEYISRKTKLKNSKEVEKQSFLQPQFCNIQKFEFSLRNHRQFVQTLV